MKYHINDFTEEKYKEIITITKNKYHFESFRNYKNKGKFILWRHDVDYSPHRARKLAEIEMKEDISSTYFIYLHSNFYSFLELEVTNIFREILAMGHEIGLHFDASYYGIRAGNYSDLEDTLNFEKNIIEKLLNTKINVFSFHNPELGNLLAVKKEKLAGMINVYSQYFEKNFTYCSDSDGYWRYQRLLDIIKSGNEKKIHVLTHSEWWTPIPMFPRERIERCVRGRSEKQVRSYDENMKNMGRKNINREEN